MPRKTIADVEQKLAAARNENRELRNKLMRLADENAQLQNQLRTQGLANGKLIDTLHMHSEITTALLNRVLYPAERAINEESRR